MEIWNLVFIQYNRDADRSLTPLPASTSIPAWASSGLPPSCKTSRQKYDTDLFQHIIRFTAQQCGRCSTAPTRADDLAFRVIADHVRAVTFLVADGMIPSNDGRGYVLRRVLRRAARHAKHLGFNEPIFAASVRRCIDTMGAAYPEIIERAAISKRFCALKKSASARPSTRGSSLLDQRRRRFRKPAPRRSRAASRSSSMTRLVFRST